MHLLQAKLILEKSMIGRLQNELVRVNSQVGELDTQLERLKRAEAECERLQKRIADLESGREGADSSLSAAQSKACPHWPLLSCPAFRIGLYAMHWPERRAKQGMPRLPCAQLPCVQDKLYARLCTTC